MPADPDSVLPPIVRTSAFARVEGAIERVLECHGILVVDGKHGVGKSTLVDDLVGRHAQPVPVIALPPRQSSRDFARALHAALALEDTDELTEHQLQDELVEILRASQLVVVRNVERMTKEAAGQLQWLHEHPSTCWSVLLEGGPGTATAVERDPLLCGRVRATVTVEPLRGDELLRTLHDLHPMFLGTDKDLLVEMDSRVCRGLLRNWSLFLDEALYLRRQTVSIGKPEPVLDRKFAKAVLNRLPTTVVRKRG